MRHKKPSVLIIFMVAMLLITAICVAFLLDEKKYLDIQREDYKYDVANVSRIEMDMK